LLRKHAFLLSPPWRARAGADFERQLRKTGRHSCPWYVSVAAVTVAIIVVLVSFSSPKDKTVIGTFGRQRIAADYDVSAPRDVGGECKARVGNINAEELAPSRP